MSAKVSREFLKAFATCANIYKWNAETVEEVKAQTRNNPELMRHWQELAKAHRAGYQQTEENNWLRLERWQQERNER